MLPAMKLIDLSVPLQDGAVSEPLPASIDYVTHDDEGLQQMQQFFGVKSEDLVFSAGEGWAIERVEAITHTGTHVDAPYHYGASSEGKPARTIDEVPLEWCFAPGVVLDVRHLGNGAVITVDDLAAALQKIDYQLQPRDIVLLQTGADQKIGDEHGGGNCDHADGHTRENPLDAYFRRLGGSLHDNIGDDVDYGE